MFGEYFLESWLGLLSQHINYCRLCNAKSIFIDINCSPLKLVNKFTYLGSSIASTEKDIDTRLTKAWAAINWLSIIGKSDLNAVFSKQRSHRYCYMHYIDSTKTTGEEARRQLHKNAASNIEQVLAATPHKTSTVRPPASYHENYST